MFVPDFWWKYLNITYVKICENHMPDESRKANIRRTFHDPWDPCMLYMVTFTINIPPMLVYIYIYTSTMDPIWQWTSPCQPRVCRGLPHWEDPAVQYQQPASCPERVKTSIHGDAGNAGTRHGSHMSGLGFRNDGYSMTFQSVFVFWSIWWSNIIKHQIGINLGGITWYCHSVKTNHR